jgi:hypothetical protein
MGIVATQVSFAAPAPALAAVATRASELCGLAVEARESSAAVKGQLFDHHGALVFACAPGVAVEAYAYRPGAVRAHVEGLFGDAGHPVAFPVQGLHEPEGTQTIYLRAPLNAEPTLLVVVLLALEALGGQMTEPLGEEERRAYGGRLTEAELIEARREWGRVPWWGWLLAPALLLVIPVAFAFTMVWVCWLVVSMPWRVRAAYRLYCQGAAGGPPPP